MLILRQQSMLLAATLFVALSCNSGPEIVSPNSAGSAANKKRTSDEENVDENDIYDEDGRLREDGSLGELAKSDPSKPVDYPQLDLRGSGTLSCKGKRYDTIGKYMAQVDASTLKLNFYEGRVVNAGSTVEDKANPQIASKLGVTTYTRPTKDERDAKVRAGFNYAPYAIFANKVVKADGSTFNFSDPLPVFPWPAKASRYDELGKAPQTWKATVTGGPDGNFNATVTVSLVGVAGDTVTVKITLDIAEDTDRHIYESFPVAKEATYTLNSKTLDVRSVNATNWYRGDDQCDGNPEDITMGYNLCVKTVKGKPENFGCP